MTDRQLEQRLQKAVSSAVPDVLDAVLAGCADREGKVIPMTKTATTRRPTLVKKLVATAAALLVLAGAAVGYGVYRSGHTVVSTIELDVNPSLSIKVNKVERVLAVDALNTDGDKVLGEMDLTGSDLDVAINAIIGSMLREGYLDELANSILISVDNADPEESAALQQRLTEAVNALLKTDTFEGAVLSQTLTHTEEVKTIAREQQITEGKAQLIGQIIKADPRYTAEQLAALSVNELNLLAGSGKDVAETVTASGTASEKKYVGRQAAKDAVFAYNGLDPAAVTDYECEPEYEQGRLVYEIDFDLKGQEYEYLVDATTGQVVWHSTDQDDDVLLPPSTTPSTSPSTTSTDISRHIGMHKARDIALAHAGVDAAAIYDYDCELDTDDATPHYEVEFKADGTEYKYDIHATTGKILEHEKEVDD